jgi:hypothetical protein
MKAIIISVGMTSSKITSPHPAMIIFVLHGAEHKYTEHTLYFC